MTRLRAPDRAPGFLDCADGTRLAYRRVKGEAPGVVFFGGFRSDMTGTKAAALEAACVDWGRAFVRFDYFGHGESGGAFTDGTIGRWREDALHVLDELTYGPQVLVGSSMGGWIMLLAALARPARAHALVGIAAAPDFTHDLMWAEFPEAIRETLRREGVYLEPSAYDEEPAPITMKLIEDGRAHLLLGGEIALPCPVRLIHGMNDPDVPWRHCLKLLERIESPDAALTLIKNGDHRLSEPDDIARMLRVVEGVL